jgi:hypothetical protein
LEYFQKSQKLNQRQARWSLYLSRFDFALFHQPGRALASSGPWSWLGELGCYAPPAGGLPDSCHGGDCG